METVALYTTVYPGVEPYLTDWYASVQAQTDQGFDLWIGVDELEPQDVVAAIGIGHLDAQWVRARPADTPAQIRTRAIAQMVETHTEIVFVDSDDVLAPTRVAAARAGLVQNDVYGCAMWLCDRQGHQLDPVFTIPSDTDPGELLPRANAFGLSNTAYRSAVLQACPSPPSECVAMDWFLATHAQAAGATFFRDPSPQMTYRQYERNQAGVLPPFDEERVRRSTTLVLRHYRIVRERGDAWPATFRHAVADAQARVRRFEQAVVESKPALRRYVRALNTLPAPHLWWEWVDHPALREAFGAPLA